MPPPAETSQVAGVTANVLVPPACVTVIVCPATVTIAVRASTLGFAAAVSVTAPGPLWPAGVTVTQLAEEVAVQGASA